MDGIKDILMIVAVILVFVLMYFLVMRFDRFLGENRRSMESENEKREPSSLMLTDDLSDEEIAEEIRRFREKHGSTRIVLYSERDGTLLEDNREDIEKY